MDEEARYLLNWLATRIDKNGEPLTKYERERRVIRRLLLKAIEMGLPIYTNGHYIPRPTRKETETETETEIEC